MGPGAFGRSSRLGRARHAQQRALKVPLGMCLLTSLPCFPLVAPCQVLDRHVAALGSLAHPGGTVLEVVTGWGKHSMQGQPRVLPAVVRYCADAGFLCDTLEDNSGVLRIMLDG